MWVEWVPDTETAVYQQLLETAGKHSEVIWMVTPPPMMRLSCTPVRLEAIKHYMDEGGIPIGYVELNGAAHNFILKPPFDPPNFKGFTMSNATIPYGVRFKTEFLTELYNEVCTQNMRKHRNHRA